jgi:hypothetical protein
VSTDTIVVPTSKPSLHSVWLLGSVVALVVSSRVIAFLHDPEIWLDEAMLMVNLPLEHMSDAFRPLPEDTQAAPPGYLLAANAILRLFGNHQYYGLRLLSIAGSLAAMVFMLLALLRLNATTLAPIALALVFLSPFGLRFGLEIQPYSFDIMATSLLLYATIRAAQRGGRHRDLALLAGAGGFAILFSFSAPLLIAGMTAGLAAAARWKRPLTVSGHSPVFVLLAFSFLAVLWHLTVTVYVTSGNHSVRAAHEAEAYLVMPFLQQSEGVGLLGFISIMFGMFDPWYRGSSGYSAQGIVAVTGCILLVIGFVAGVRRIPFVTWSCAAFLCGIAGLSVLGLYPVVYNRYFAFVQPVLGIVIAAGLAVLGSFMLRAARGRPGTELIRVGSAVLLVTGLGYVALNAALSQEKSHLRLATAVVEAETRGQGAFVHVSGAVLITLPFVDSTFVEKMTLVPIEMSTQAQSAVEADMTWVIYAPAYDDDLQIVLKMLEQVHTVFGPCDEIFRAGSGAELGYTLVFRCGPAAR